MISDFPPVRPTRRALDDLGAKLPDLATPLHELDDPLIVVAQSLPELKVAGGAERVVSLTDRVWFKVKTGTHRAAATELRDLDRPDHAHPLVGGWWIGAAGQRQADSPQRDFYAHLLRECTTGKSVSTVRLLPVDWDWKRLTAEQAIAWRREMRRLVLHLIALSLTSGRLVIAEFKDHRIKALVRADDGHEAYLAIAAEGIPDPQIFAALLSCVPGVEADDWQPEPSPLAELEPGPGEIIWSTLLAPEIATVILEQNEANS